MNSRVVIKHNEDVICKQGKMAISFMDRLIGLMFKSKMEDFDGLIIEPCRSIHTFFMRYSLDVIFLTKKNTIVKIIRNMGPWRMSLIYFTAYKVLELKSGSVDLSNLKKGDRLEVVCTS